MPVKRVYGVYDLPLQVVLLLVDRLVTDPDGSAVPEADQAVQ